jgi:hypothetical protein
MWNVGPSALLWAAFAWAGLWLGRQGWLSRNAARSSSDPAELEGAHARAVIVLPGDSAAAEPVDPGMAIRPSLDSDDLPTSGGFLGRSSSW